MKYIVLFASFAAVLHCINGTTTLSQAQDRCENESPVSKAVQYSLLEHRMVEDLSLKDYTFCLYKNIGFQNEDGTFNVGTMRDISHKLKGDTALESVIVQCASSPTQSGSENAWLWLLCMKQTLNPLMFYSLCNTFWGFKL